MKKTILALAVIGLMPTSAMAFDCTDVANYDESNAYKTGEAVQVDGNAFVCKVGGWCSVGGPYAPITGWASSHAWSDEGTCSLIVETDTDNDGITDEIDNCVDIANPDQTDSDNNGIGDACDIVIEPDSDNDGIADSLDNCPINPNPDQADSDNNGIGDVCDVVIEADTDGDGIKDSIDNCPNMANPDQADSDNNGIGDACEVVIEPDTDNDGVIDSLDNCPLVENSDQADSDNNGIGDACDIIIIPDSDNDGVADTLDNCPTTANPDQLDSDNNGIGDVCETSAVECPSFDNTATYDASSIVKSGDAYYKCDVAGWCSAGSSAYEPGIGWAWESAWSSSTLEACTSVGGGVEVPDVAFCAPDWDTKKIYGEGSVVNYNGVAWQASKETYGIAPDNTTYGEQYTVVGYPDDFMCPVKIPNDIDYGTPQPVAGNANVGIQFSTGAVDTASISNTPSSQTGKVGGIDPATDNGGDHAGLSGDNGARVSKLTPGSVENQHNVYDQNSGTEIVTYIGDWAIYGRQYDFSKLSASNLNRIVYGFAGICYPDAKNEQDGGFPTTAPAAVMRTCEQSNLPDGAMAVADFEAAFSRKITGAPEGSVIGIESMYEIEPENVSGVFGVLYELRKQNPHLKLDLSVGGWTLSEGFPWMASDPVRRKVFVDSIVHFLERFDFDGIDIDWEYPASDGAVPGMARPDDAQTYALLIQELRAGMDWLTKKTGKKYRLSSAIPAGEGRLEKIDWSVVHPYMDRLYAMTYDMTGAWERELSHHTPLYTNPNATGSSAKTSADFTMNYLQGLGIPANKLMIGVANYHRSRAMNPGDITEYTNGLNGTTTYGDMNATGANMILGISGVGSWEAGVLEGYDLYSNYLDKDLKARNGYTLYTDKASNADYLVNESIGSFITLETPRTTALKTQYAKDNGLAGVFFWMAEQDNGYNLNAVNHVLGNTLKVDNANSKPQHQIAICGTNVTVAECEALNAPLKK